MISRTARTSLVAFLLIVGAAGAYLGFDTSQRQTRAVTRAREVESRLDAMLSSVNELAITQRGYFEPRVGTGSSGPQFERVRTLTEELKQQLDTLRSLMNAPDAIEQQAAIGAALNDFSTTDTRVRTNLANDTYFSAADLVFSASANQLRTVTGALTALKSLAAADNAVQDSTLQRRMGMIVGAVSLVWTIGLLLLVRPGQAAASTSNSDQLRTIPDPAVESRVAPDPVPAASSPPATVDVEAAARVCTDIASATSAVRLREIMADAAAVVDATGMIVWLGAGEELFAVLGHGYDPRMLSRIGPIPRQASNATALAWRTGSAQTVPGEGGRSGAVVSPLVSAQGCIGVLSAEVAPGRETDNVVRSVIALFAAQLSAIVAAWPEPSAAAHAGDPQSGTVAVTL